MVCIVQGGRFGRGDIGGLFEKKEMFLFESLEFRELNGERGLID